MDVVARLNFIRMSPKKIRPVVNSIKKLTPSKAVIVLKFSDKSVARPLTKLIDSAIANAEHNNGADIDELKIAKVYADQGPTYKRMQAKAKPVLGQGLYFFDKT